MIDLIGNTISSWNTQSINIKFTPEGGIATRVINDTGSPSIKGTIVHASPNIYNAVSIIPIDNPDPIGIVYDNGIINGEYMWIVQFGKAQVLYSTPVNRGTFSRCPLSIDGAAIAGRAINQVLPLPPFATDKHFLEIGHPTETIAAPGLALTFLHFN